jgi:histidinol-phosphate/aromatic aminotransferase/cobyric acid decarboxylase-like protein
MIDLSRNEVFQACPRSVLEQAFLATAESANRYPGELKRQVENKLAADWGFSRKALLLTRGVDDAVELFARMFAGSRFVTFEPGFDGFGHRLDGRHASRTALPWPIEDAGPPDLSGIAPDDAVLVASPGNPCGRTMLSEALRRISETARGMFIDHTYFDFSYAALSGETYAESTCELFAPGVFHYFSFSKAWALAGLRLGAIVSEDRSAIEKMRAWQMYDVIDTFSLHCVRNAASMGYARSIAAETLANRDELASMLLAGGWNAIAREGNFICARDPERRLANALNSGGFPIRDLSPLDLPGWIRIAAPPPHALPDIMGILETLNDA